MAEEIALIVVDMHRSGTSAMAQLLSLTIWAEEKSDGGRAC